LGMSRQRLWAGVSVLALLSGTSAHADDTKAFELGRIEEILVTGRKVDTKISNSTLSSDDIYTFKIDTLDRALDLIPGAASSNTGGSRNERLIFVRGFDRFQVPLSIDGVRVYLPADNRLDFGFFLTADLAEVQVQKGYVSVLDGPGGMGGAINLVTRKPTKEFEAEARAGAIFGEDLSYNGVTTYGSAGTKQDKYYLQASGAWTDVTRTQLPSSTTPTASENGGFRDFSSRENWRLNFKAGFTPNDTDEYSVSYTKQSGDKEAPLHVTDAATTQRNWTWPYWDIDSVYFLSSTNLGSDTKLKTKAYYNTFENLLSSFDNRNLTTQTLARAFNSYYDDYAYGGSFQLEQNLGDFNVLKGSVQYRRDNHTEWQQIFVPRNFTEPDQVTREDTWSFALENRTNITPQLDWVVGASYDFRDLKRAEDFVTPTTATGTGNTVTYGLSDSPAWNEQAALIYTYSDTGTVYANVSNRTRFPTLFDRFSSRFGGATSNPTLKPERALNLETGIKENITDDTRLEAAVFYSDVNNVIVSVPFIFQGSAVTQSQNVGDAEYYGLEASVDTRITPDATVGVRYTYTKRNIDNPANAAFQLTGQPGHQAFAFLKWNVLPELTITPNINASSKRWTVTTNGLTYYKVGSFVLANTDFDYAINKNVDLSFSVKNIFDADYILVDGFPEEGRTFQLNLRTRF
jgi:iron complex outermembrane receptor protein